MTIEEDLSKVLLPGNWKATLQCFALVGKEKENLIIFCDEQLASSS